MPPNYMYLNVVFIKYSKAFNLIAIDYLFADLFVDTVLFKT